MQTPGFHQTQAQHKVLKPRYKIRTPLGTLFRGADPVLSPTTTKNFTCVAEEVEDVGAGAEDDEAGAGGEEVKEDEEAEQVL